METEKKQIVEKKVYEDGKKEYASKGLANTALGFGIAGLGAALWGRNGGLGSILGGNNVPENVNINTSSATGSGAAPSAFQVFEKECSDHVATINEMWSLKLDTEQEFYAHRETDIKEKFGLYKSQVDADHALYRNQVDMGFGLYKNQRDIYDVLNERYGSKFAELDKKVAVMEAIRPYQDKLIQCEIEKAYTAGINYVDRKTCKMITGQVVLPSTPTVTGYGSYNPFITNSTPATGG